MNNHQLIYGYNVVESYYDSTDCSGNPYSSVTYYCNSTTNCNCDGSIDDCTIATYSFTGCDTDEFHLIFVYATDVCFYAGSSYYDDYAEYQCDGSDNIEFIYYGDKDCTEESYNQLDTTSPYCRSCDDDDDYCWYYVEMQCGDIDSSNSGNSSSSSTTNLLFILFGS